MKLLLRPKPLPDELFSSWLVRLAAANVRKVHPFAKHFFPDKTNFWNRDLDLTLEPEELEPLAEIAGVDPVSLAQTLLKSYAGTVFERIPVKGSTRWVLQLRNKGRIRHAYGQQYCWKCLASDPVPYFRKHWRLAFNVACPEHGCWLLDACPHCGAPISFHESDFGTLATGLEEGILRCRRCMGLRTDVELSFEEVSDELLQFQRRLMIAVEQGFDRQLPGAATCAFLFFTGLRHIVRVLNAPGRSSALKEYLLRQNGRLDLTRPAKHGIENARLGDRAETLRLAATLLKDWPAGFIAACRAARFSSWHFHHHGEVLPYWIALELKWHLYDRFYAPNDDERRAVRIYLEKRGMSPCRNEVNRLLGVAYRALTPEDELHVTGRSWIPRGPRRRLVDVRK